MSRQKLSIMRLQKQQRILDEDPIPLIMVMRKGPLNFHFCIFGLDGVYKNGFYHGVLQLHEDYPFAPPRLLFYTPSGRFETNKPICTSFTDYHKQTWTAGWNVRTMLTAIVSFMTSEEHGAGVLNDSYFARRSYAEKSLSWNMKNELFRELFVTKIKQRPELQEKLLNLESNSESQAASSRPVPAQSNKLYILYLALFVLIIMWTLIKAS